MERREEKGEEGETGEHVCMCVCTQRGTECGRNGCHVYSHFQRIPAFCLHRSALMHAKDSIEPRLQSNSAVPFIQIGCTCWPLYYRHGRDVASVICKSRPRQPRKLAVFPTFPFPLFLFWLFAPNQQSQKFLFLARFLVFLAIVSIRIWIRSLKRIINLLNHYIIVKLRVKRCCKLCYRKNAFFEIGTSPNNCL